MRRLMVLIGTTVLLTLAAVPAHAKGPTGVTIEGPGIAAPVVVDGNGEYSSGTEFSAFVEAAGFWEVVFAADMDGGGLAISDEPPTSDLGPEYLVTWHLVDARVPASMYPAAAGGPLVYVEPGLEVEGFGTTTNGGWFSAPPELATMLAEYRVRGDGAKLVGEPVPTLPVAPSATDGEVDELEQSLATATTLSTPKEAPATTQLDTFGAEAAQGANNVADVGQPPRTALPVVALVAAAGLGLAGALTAWWRRRVAPQ